MNEPYAPCDCGSCTESKLKAENERLRAALANAADAADEILAYGGNGCTYADGFQDARDRAKNLRDQARAALAGKK